MGEQEREAKGRKKKQKWGQGRQEWGRCVCVWKCGEVDDYENVFIQPMTDGRCCQPGSGSHCLTVTEA